MSGEFGVWSVEWGVEAPCCLIQSHEVNRWLGEPGKEIRKNAA